MKYFNMFFLFLTFISYFFVPNITKEDYYYVMEDKDFTNKVELVIKEEKISEQIKEETIDTFYGDVTAYGIDCVGCIGITASGYDVRNTIYYDDNEYGKIRIVAADKSIPFGSIIKIKYYNDDIIAIVLDRGGAIGFNNGALIDLLFDSENECYEFGRINTKVEVLRYGF